MFLHCACKQTVKTDDKCQNLMCWLICLRKFYFFADFQFKSLNVCYQKEEKYIWASSRENLSSDF